MIYGYFFIKSVVKWSEKSVRFEFFMGIAFQMGQIFAYSISTIIPCAGSNNACFMAMQGFERINNAHVL